MWLRFARTVPIKLAASGLVVVEGKVSAAKTLSIPGSQVRPVYYDMVLESFRAIPGGRGRAGWTVDRADAQIVPFVLEDEQGQIWISAERERVVVKGGWLDRGTTGRQAAGRYSARLIAPGDTVRVRGEVFEPRRAPVARGLRAPKDRPLEILFRARATPVSAEAAGANDEGGPRRSGSRRPGA